MIQTLKKKVPWKKILQLSRWSSQITITASWTFEVRRLLYEGAARSHWCLACKWPGRLFGERRKGTLLMQKLCSQAKLLLSGCKKGKRNAVTQKRESEKWQILLLNSAWELSSSEAVAYVWLTLRMLSYSLTKKSSKKPWDQGSVSTSFKSALCDSCWFMLSNGPTDLCLGLLVTTCRIHKGMQCLNIPLPEEKSLYTYAIKFDGWEKNYIFLKTGFMKRLSRSFYF